MAISGHKFNLNGKTLAKIEHLLPRLKYSVLPSKIIRWLENFNEDEIDLAIDLLSVFEYIPFNEFMYRLNDLLKKILDDIPKGEKILILPYGKVGKSATLVTYPLKNTIAFKKREKDIELNHDYEKLKNPKIFKHIIFLDDFIGSGKTFYKEYTKKKDKENSIEEWVKDNSIANVYILATIIMVEGKEFINSKFSNIRIEADERHKIFDKTNSPLIAFNNIKKLEKLTERYGNLLFVSRFPPHYIPFGYDNSQSLISFFHCTPNNTLTIIWKKNGFWFPLYPRESKKRMDEAREFKKEIAFYIGICNRLGIDIYNGKTILEERDKIKVRVIKYNTRQDHSIISLLTLKNQGYEDLLICHILGLTMVELDDIYKESKKVGFTDTLKNISSKGNMFLEELKVKTKKENFREATQERLMFKNEFYMPKSFKGET